MSPLKAVKDLGWVVGVNGRGVHRGRGWSGARAGGVATVVGYKGGRAREWTIGALLFAPIGAQILSLFCSITNPKSYNKIRMVTIDSEWLEDYSVEYMHVEQ
jgi:hypothetical protein